MTSPTDSVVRRVADKSDAPAMTCTPDLTPGTRVGTSIMFGQDDRTLDPVDKTLIATEHAAWLTRGGIDTLTVHGFASSDGTAKSNWTLSCDRAEAVKAELVRLGVPAGIVITIAHGETEEFSATSLAPNRRAVIRSVAGTAPTPPPTPPARTTRDIEIVVKSFINIVFPRVGATICSVFDPTSQTKLTALAAATDVTFHENPTTSAQDLVYRLFTRQVFTVTCENGRIVSVTPATVTLTTITTDVGHEGPLVPPPIILSAITSTLSGGVFTFSWFAEGRPHLAAEPAFQVVCPRISRFIWHTLDGRLSCSGAGVTATARIDGSHFSSHRLFINGVPTSSIPQGMFSNLWVPSPSDPSRVA
jgi:hypothetical protein